MKIHEYQAKGLLKEYGIPIPESGVATSAEEVVAIAKELGGRVVVKAQIHAGGRGMGGGVKVVDGPDEAKAAAEGMLGKPLITYQTGPEGQVVSKVIVEGAVGIASELYLGMVIDRATEKIAFMASTEGGVEIEKVAAETPEKILKEFADPGLGLMPYQARNLAYGLGMEGKTASAAASFIMKLYKLFVVKDWALAEMVDQIQKRLLSLELMTKLGKLDLAGIDLDEGKRLLSRCREIIEQGVAGYVTLTGVRDA